MNRSGINTGGAWCAAVLLVVGMSCSNSSETRTSTPPDLDGGSGGGTSDGSSSGGGQDGSSSVPGSDGGGTAVDGGGGPVSDGGGAAEPSCDPRTLGDCPGESTCQCDFDHCWCQEPPPPESCNPRDANSCDEGYTCSCFSGGGGCVCEATVAPECRITDWGVEYGCEAGQHCDCDSGTCHCVDDLSCDPDAANACALDEQCRCRDQVGGRCYCEPWTCWDEGEPNDALCPADHECLCLYALSCSCVLPCPNERYTDCPEGLVCRSRRNLDSYYCLPEVMGGITPVPL